MKNRFVSVACLAGVLVAGAPSWVAGANPPMRGIPPEEVSGLVPGLREIYVDLHEHPELSLHEERTAQVLAARLAAIGFEVTAHVGGTGIVGVLRNGAGPTVLLRTELDALPVEEKTGLPIASHVRTKDDAGRDVPVMHACGHDLHMTSWLGTATLMARHRAGWHGTLVFIAQPAEERAMGAKAMLKDGLFSRFPKPDVAIALHDTPKLPAGEVAVVSGPAYSSSDSVNLTIFGKGGHGAMPQTTVDPIVLAARVILGLQTLVSRENNPLDPAIVTVGSIHAGTKHNIIPDEAFLQLTVRAYKPEVRNRLIAGIARVAEGEAISANAPKKPEMVVVESSGVTVNDPATSVRVGAALRRELGDGHVVELSPEMVSEDFSEYGKAGIPAVTFQLGAADPAEFAKAKSEGRMLPSLHSALFVPDFEPALTTGIRSECAALLEFLGH
jgi:amidohydrolase